MEQELLKQLRERLEREKQDLQKRLAGFAKRNHGVPDDWVTRFPGIEGQSLEEEADEVEEYESLLPQEAALETKLREVKLALERIDKGSFGKCEKCGKEIERERLEALPETRVCEKCKR